MLYISGENDTLASLYEAQGLSWGLENYAKRFTLLNPKVPCANVISPYSLLNLPTNDEKADRETLEEYMPILAKSTLEEMKSYRKIQEEHHDLMAQLGMQEIMEGFQRYAIDFADFYNSPLINTPWNDLNESVPGSSLIDVFAGVSGFMSGYIRSSTRFVRYDELYDHMLKRDALNRQLYLMPKTRGNVLARVKLEEQIKVHTSKIKEILPKRLNDTITRHLSKKYTAKEIIKLRSNAYSKKMAGKGRLATTNLDFLNRSGLKRLKGFADHMNTFGKWGDRAALWLGPAVVAYDTYHAYHSKDRSAMRAFLTGSASVGVGIGLGSLFSTSAFGSALIGTALGAPGAGGLLLICSPVVGWVVCAAVGLVAVGYLSYKASEVVGYVWDHRQEIGTYAASVYESVEKKIISIWDSSQEYFRKLYGTTEPVKH